MMSADVTALLGETDIYLVDQIMKRRYREGDRILDAGCGRGRNLHWFLQNNFEIYAVDADAEAIKELRQNCKPLAPERLLVHPVEQLPFESAFFDGIISSAVLHFARSGEHFFAMIAEMYRVLKPFGTLFIRMASDIGIEHRIQHFGDGIYLLPDGSTRFLLTRSLLEQMLTRFPFSFLDVFKTVNVADMRCMSTLMLQKDK